MSAGLALARKPTYQEQVGLVRAEAVVEMLEAAFDRVVEALRIDPAVSEEEEQSAQRRICYGTFY